MDSKSQLIHLYRRAGFGLTPEQLEQTTTIQDALDQLLNPKGTFQMKSALKLPDNWASLSKTERQTILIAARKANLQLGGQWIEHMSTSDDVLLEKMTLFWHGHFACSTNNRPDFAVSLNNTMRENALGNFRTLTKAVSQEAAMLDFLNNTQNSKDSPNENFARELMELFTIGRDNYSEADIKEAARAFTGWAHYPDGRFVLRKRKHDYGQKIFFGYTGNFDGNDIIDILCQDKRTAQFIARKLYLFFVADQPDQQAINQLADILFSNDYEIKPTLRYLFTADWFYEAAGTKIKSPVELIVGLNRSYGIAYHDSKTLLFFQRGLGQHLFRPPNVAGWPGGRKWIDSTTLAYRMRLPSIVLNGGVIEWNLKDEPDTMIAMKTRIRNKARTKTMQRLQVTVDWDKVENTWGNIPPAELVDLQLPSAKSPMAKDMINASRTDLRSLTSTILSLPEFQLC